jgi:hypothetical protein
MATSVLRCVVVAATLFLLMLPLDSNEARAQNLTCEDFGSQAKAQDNLRHRPIDRNHLDPDNNGIACENFPHPKKKKDVDPVPGDVESALPDTGGALQLPSLTKASVPRSRSHIPIAMMRASAVVFAFVLLFVLLQLTRPWWRRWFLGK